MAKLAPIAQTARSHLYKAVRDEDWPLARRWLALSEEICDAINNAERLLRQEVSVADDQPTTLS